MGSMEEDTGRCINCGFFGKRSLGEQIPIVIEVTNPERTKGQPEPVAGRSTRVVCYRNKIQFTFQPPSHDPEKIKEEIQKARECQFWYSYEEGRSPEKHFEELRMLELERRREEFEHNMEERRKEFELRMENDSKSFELKLDERNRVEQNRTNTIMFRLTWVGVALAFAQVLTATSDSWIGQLVNWILGRFR